MRWHRPRSWIRGYQPGGPPWSDWKTRLQCQYQTRRLHESRTLPMVREISCIIWTYLMIDLHFDVESVPANRVLTWVMKFDVLWVPLNCLGNLVIWSLSCKDLTKVTVNCVCEVGGRVNFSGHTSFVGWQEGEAHAFWRLVPVKASHIEVHWWLLLSRVIAVCEVPVTTTRIIVPFWVPCANLLLNGIRWSVNEGIFLIGIG